MTRDRKRKRAIRARMAETGETYTQAAARSGCTHPNHPLFPDDCLMPAGERRRAIERHVAACDEDGYPAGSCRRCGESWERHPRACDGVPNDDAPVES